MNITEPEIYNCIPNHETRKIRGVIVLTDNRLGQQIENNSVTDYRCSAFKETEADPLQFGLMHYSHTHDKETITQLNQRLTILEERVRVLSNYDGIIYLQNENEVKPLKKKNRRKFRQLVRNQVCPHCGKLYGSQTSLKYHLKLKHNQLGSQLN